MYVSLDPSHCFTGLFFELFKFGEVSKYLISSSTVENLFSDGTATEEVPSSIDYLSRPAMLNLSDDCKRLESLPRSLCKLRFLPYLCL